MSAASPHIKGHYTVVKVVPGEIILRGQLVDLRSIKLEKARELFQEGFRYLKPSRKEKAYLKNLAESKNENENPNT